jgi:hypothetical protein
MALTFPTAEDVHIRGTVNHPRLLLRDPTGRLPPLPVAYQLDVDATIRNQTYNITPFIGYVKTPTSRIFHQGFLQVDVPLNQSSTLIDLDYAIDAGAVTFDPPRSITTDRVQPQTILRADLGAGYWFINDPGAPYLNQLGIMAEVHYTTTVNNSELFAPSQVLPGVGQYTPAALSFCNNANRVDNLNFVAAIPLRLGQTTITNAFITPLSTGDNRLFDFEYSLFVNRSF